VEIDWLTAEVKAPLEGGPFVLSMDLRGRYDRAFTDAWERETHRLATALGDDRRQIRVSSTRETPRGDSMGIEISPINPDDADGERQAIEDVVARVNRAAEPERARYEEEDRRRKEEREARARQAESLTRHFRGQG
jgi:hypothetical protein